MSLARGTVISVKYLVQSQGCGITMPDSYIEPAGQVDFPG